MKTRVIKISSILTALLITCSSCATYQNQTRTCYPSGQIKSESYTTSSSVGESLLALPVTIITLPFALIQLIIAPRPCPQHVEWQNCNPTYYHQPCQLY